MRPSGLGSLLLLTSAAACAQPSESNEWWSYLAEYDAGPGSIRLDLKLRKNPPIKQFPYVVVSGVTYTSSRKDGLPEAGDIDRINGISTALVSAIARHSPSIHAGTFTHNFEQLNYIYVPNGEGLAAVIGKVYGKLCAGCKTYTNIKKDPAWSAYREFLYPNEVTRKHYRLQLD